MTVDVSPGLTRLESESMGHIEVTVDQYGDAHTQRSSTAARLAAR